MFDNPQINAQKGDIIKTKKVTFKINDDDAKGAYEQNQHQRRAPNYSKNDDKHNNNNRGGDDNSMSIICAVFFLSLIFLIIHKSR